MPPTFKDNAGREWRVTIDAAAAARVRELTGVDLSRPGEALIRIGLGLAAGRPATAVDVLYAACKPDADAQGVTDADFGRAMSGVIDTAAAALIEAVIGLLPAGAREDAMEMWENTKGQV